MLYARIENGRVAELIAAADEAELQARFHPDLVGACVPADGGMEVGWTWNGAAFAPPAPPAPPPPRRRLSALAFRRRLSPARRAAGTRAARPELGGGDATLQVWLDDLNAAGEVTLDDPETVAGVAAVLAAGLITTAERDALLADPTEQET